MEGVKESLFSAHFGRHNTEFASVWVVTSKSLSKEMWAEFQVKKEIILRDCVCVSGWRLSTKEERINHSEASSQI